MWACGSSMSQQSCIAHGSATSPFVGGIGTTYVTPQVFAEMPTPSSSWIEQQRVSSRPPAFPLASETVSELGAHQVFDERVAPGYNHQMFGRTAPGYSNNYYGHQNPILNSCLQSDSTTPTEQYLAGMPQPYGFHNLNRQSLFLADGTEHSYYVLPENYSFECTTSSTSPAMPTVEVRSSCQSFTPPMNCIVAEKQTHPGQETLSIPDMLAQLKAKLEIIIENYENRKHSHERTLLCTEEKVAAVTTLPSQDPHEQEQLAKEISTYFIKASENGIPSQQPPMSATATDQMQFQAFESMPNYDVYEKEDSACLNIILHERDFTLELQQQDDDKECNFSVLKASNSFVTRCSHLSIEHSRRELRLLWDPGPSKFPVLFMTAAGAAKLQGTDVYKSEFTSSYEIQKLLNSLVNVKKMIPWPFWKLQKLQHGNNQQGNVFISEVRRKEWDPGILNQMDIMLVLLASCRESTEKCLADQELMANTSTKVAALTWPSSLPGTPIILLSSTTYTWDPGVFTHVLQPIVASAIKCSYAFALEWTEVKIAAVLVLVVPCSKVEVTKQRLPLEFLLMDEMLQNVSEFRVGQLTYMAQSPAPNFSALLRPMVTVLYCWLPSFENKAKLQWDPGIALPWYIYSWLEICRAGQKTAVTFSFVLLFHCHQDPKLAGTALWLITFNPP